MVPKQIYDQVSDKASEGLALALADENDGAIMVFQWCNRAFTQITGYAQSDVIGQRGTVLIGPDVVQSNHLLIIEKLMNWETFSMTLLNNRKDGALCWQRMGWTPLSDPVSGQRWWLCSLIDLPDHNGCITNGHSADVALLDHTAETDDKHRLRQLERENAHLQALAATVAKESNEDALTGLSNRRHFEVELKSWISDLKADGSDFAVLYIDLDRFKLVNDTLGHDAGDRLLVTVAGILRKLTTNRDLVARIGGDEFIILRPLGDSALSISGLADQIVAEMQAPFAFDGQSASTSASIGVAIAHAQMPNPHQVVADADTALYHAKSQGRGRWSFFTDKMHADLLATKRLASDLLDGCERREFTVYFQPVVAATNGQLASVEALVRWSHPTKGLLLPAVFLDTAASMGILRKIDEMVFKQLCDTFAHFEATCVDLPHVAINISAERLADPNLLHDIKRSGIDPHKLTVEILESVFLDRMNDIVRSTLDGLAEMGVTVAIDDFGTGHASIQGLLQIKPAVMKIDRQFIQPIVDDKVARALVRSIIGIGKSLGMGVVAEGVETKAHADVATDMGCDYLQGYHFGKPMSADALHRVLSQSGGHFTAVQSDPQAASAHLPGK